MLSYLNTSFVSGYPLCPYRATRSQEERSKKGNDAGGNDPTRFGQIVHRVAERMHVLDMAGETAEPMALFDEEFRASPLASFDYYQLGRDKLEEFIDRTLYNRNGPTIAAEITFLLDLVHLTCVVIEDAHTPAARAKVKRLSQKILLQGGVPFVSTIDRVDRVDPTFLEVHDYKTNRSPFSNDEVDNSMQLLVYDIAVRCLWPETERVVCVFDLIRYGRFPTEFTDERRETGRLYLINIWHQAQNERPLPTLNPYCSWCDYKLDCGVYAAAVAGDLTHPFTAGEEMTLEEMWQAYRDCRQVEKLAGERAVQFYEVIGAVITEHDAKPVPLSKDDELYFQLNPRYEYPIEAVFAILQRREALSWLKFISRITNTELERFLKGKPELREEINAAMRTTYVKPTIKKRARTPTS